MQGAERSGLLRQPRIVWAVAFACVIAFMGLGLVDPILPTLAKQLQATPSEVELLFTSYILCMALAMLVTSTISSWIGIKRTLIVGLVLIIGFSALAGSSGSIAEIVGFRAGWGVGNALFVATALAAIVGAASGGIGSAINLYEAAIGIGIATGPILGGLLGGISWRGPFFGASCLMVVALIATVVTLPPTARPARRVSVLEPLRALREPGLRTMSLTALGYNFGFFTLFAYTPFPIGLDAHGLGLVFFGWGIGVALTSVFVAPRLRDRFGTLRTIQVVLASIAILLVIGGIFTTSRPTLIAVVVVSGFFLGVSNALITQGVMKVAVVPRPIASAGYSFVRFIGGAIAPYLAARLGEVFNPHVPFFFGAAAILLALVVLLAGGRHLGRIDAPETEGIVPGPAESVPLGERAVAGGYS
ncbi:MAG TPA: MFS transporter [Clostridia bacterium]|nr:MFS transporter [Clostridia bacterium]